MNEFLTMGGYGFYIWTAYGVSFLVLAVDALVNRLQQRKTLQNLAQFHQTQHNSTKISDEH